MVSPRPLSKKAIREAFFILFSPSAYPVLKGVNGMEKETGQSRSGVVKNHMLTLDNRRRATLTGVNEVLGFDENIVNLRTDNGEVTITGEGLHVTKLMLEEGQLALEGKIDGIQYAAQRIRRVGLFRRGEK